MYRGKDWKLGLIARRREKSCNWVPEKEMKASKNLKKGAERGDWDNKN